MKDNRQLKKLPAKSLLTLSAVLFGTTIYLSTMTPSAWAADTEQTQIISDEPEDSSSVDIGDASEPSSENEPKMMEGVGPVPSNSEDEQQTDSDLTDLVDVDTGTDDNLDPQIMYSFSGGQEVQRDLVPSTEIQTDAAPTSLERNDATQIQENSRSLTDELFSKRKKPVVVSIY